jgi:hypothetical protein
VLNSVVALVVARTWGLHGNTNNHQLGCALDDQTSSWFCAGSIVDIAFTLAITNAITAPLMDCIPIVTWLFAEYYACYAETQEQMDYIYAPPEASPPRHSPWPPGLVC